MKQLVRVKRPPVFKTAIARIYILSDMDGNVFYVGCTIQPLFVRLKMHLCEAKINHSFTNKAKNKKIQLLDFKVLITEVDRMEVSGYEGYQMTNKAKDLELSWVKKYKSMGCQLTNSKELKQIDKMSTSQETTLLTNDK